SENTGIAAAATKAISTVAAIAARFAKSSNAAISSESISTVTALYRAVVYDTNKVHLMVRPERNSGAAIATKRVAPISVAAIATKRVAAISRPASAAVAAVAAVASSSVAASAARSANTGSAASATNRY